MSEQQEQRDHAAIQITVHEYFEGLRRCNLDRLRRIFFRTARICGHREGKLSDLSLEEWLRLVGTRPAPSNTDPSFNVEIKAIGYFKTIATVTLSEWYMGIRFTTVLTMMIIEQRWQVLNKAFRHD
jgi:hypothetical protein